MPYGFFGCCSRFSRNNREINREFFATTSGIIKFCPKSENLVLKQGINREFCGYLRKPKAIKYLLGQ
jgi:hypothetical protein